MSHLYLLKLTSLSPEMTFALGCRTDFTAQWQQASKGLHAQSYQQLAAKCLWEIYPPFTSICSAVK